MSKKFSLLEYSPVLGYALFSDSDSFLIFSPVVGNVLTELIRTISHYNPQSVITIVSDADTAKSVCGLDAECCATIDEIDGN